MHRMTTPPGKPIISLAILSEAAFMTGQTNADVVRLATYAPLFLLDAHGGIHLIWFDNLHDADSNYYVQQMYVRTPEQMC